MYGISSYIDYLKHSRVNWIVNDIKFYLWFNMRGHVTPHSLYKTCHDNTHNNTHNNKTDKLKNWIP